MSRAALEQAALAALRARAFEILALTEQLVQVNSHSANVEGVNEVAALLRDVLATTRLECATTHSNHTGDHLVFSTERAHEEPAILLVGHHDTVFPKGSFEGFHVEGDIARGPGVLDMKSGLALVIVVLRALYDVNALSRLPLRFISVGDEELGSPSSKMLLEQLGLHARCGLVFEAGRKGDAIITSRRGSGSAAIFAHGRAAHAGNALASGRNAIWALAKFIDEAQQLTDVERGFSVNVGLVEGGTSRNTVPDRARADLDLRFADAEGQHTLISALHDAARRACHAIEGTRLEVDVHVARAPWARSEASVALAQRYAACQRAAGLEAGEAPRVGGGSDANTLGALGLPTIDGLGARGEGFHTRDEWISISSLPMKAEALMRFLLSEIPH